MKDTSTVFDFFSDKVKPSRKTEEECGRTGSMQSGHVDILKYLVEERKISDR